MLLKERWTHHLDPMGSIGVLYVVVKKDIGILSKCPSPYYANQVSNSSYELDRSYNEKKEEQDTESNKIYPRLLDILVRLDTMGENLEDMNKEALG